MPEKWDNSQVSDMYVPEKWDNSQVSDMYVPEKWENSQVSDTLSIDTYVFIRYDTVKKPLQPLYMTSF